MGTTRAVDCDKLSRKCQEVISIASQLLTSL